MLNKYARQRRNALLKIIAKGTTCTWYKAGEAVGNDPTPEFPELLDSADFPRTPIVLIPSDKLGQQTVVYNTAGEVAVVSLFALLPGDLPFTPEESDAVLVQDVLRHVTYINTTQPDGIPIVHEIGMR